MTYHAPYDWEAIAAAEADARDEPPLDQDTADLIAAILAPTVPAAPAA